MKADLKTIYSRTRKDGNCRVWTGKIDEHVGYPRIGFTGFGMQLVHRMVFFLMHGWWPEHVHHICENKACVWWVHLSAETHKTHRRDHHMFTHCTRGHEYTPENTTYFPSRKGRVCRECCRIEEKNRAKRIRPYVRRNKS